MQFYPHRTVEEQAARLPEELREAYKNSQIDRIKLFDGKEVVEVHGYFEYSFLEEKSYADQPTRAIDGSISNIDDYKTFLTPRLIIKYNMMHIDDYRTLMKKLKENNGIIVICYDPVEDRIVKKEMYFAPPSMPIIYQQYLMALGIQEYSIELIGTNYTPSMVFYIDLTVYFTKKGMTWREWVDANYSPRYAISGDYVVNAYEKKVAIDGNYVHPDDFIIKSAFYTTI